MAGLAHMGLGFAAKRFCPEVPVGYLVLATEVIDLAWAAMAAVGLESLDRPPYWSHSLVMALVWSSAAAALAWIISRRLKTAAWIGGLAFSHFILDLITHPMGAVMGRPGAPPDIPLAFAGSPLWGFGLYNQSVLVAWVFELAVTGGGVALYVAYALKQRRAAIGG